MISKKITAHFLILIVSVLLINGCDIIATGSDDSQFDLIEELLPVCSVSDGIVDINVYSEGPITTSFNRLYFDIFEDGTKNRISESDLTVTPMMNMSTHTHAAPVWQPGHVRNTESQLFEAAIIPTMPGGEQGSWTLQWDAGNGIAGESCDMEVTPSSDVKIFTAGNNERYVLTWIHPQNPKTGSNDLTLSLHHRESMMSFPEVQDLQLEIRPWMGSMDHGSEGNVDPVPTGIGFYEGSAVFSMSGDWQVYVTIIDNDEIIHETIFELPVN